MHTLDGRMGCHTFLEKGGLVVVFNEKCTAMVRWYAFALMIFSGFALYGQTDQGVVWGTYMGGPTASTQESLVQVYGSAVCPDGGILVAGNTNIASGFATADAHQDVFGGGWDDAYLAKYSDTGSLLWCTYFGGLGEEIILDVSVGPNGEIAVVGETSSFNGIASEGAFLSDHSGSFGKDGFLAVFNQDGERLWSTYYGGSGVEEAFRAVAFKADGEIIVAGLVNSPDLATDGAFQETLLGDISGIIVIFSGSGERLLATYFGGNEAFSGHLRIVDIAVDGLGNILALMEVNGVSLPVTPDAHMSEQPGSTTSALAKFDSQVNLIWSTYHGTAASDEAGSIAIGAENEVYLSGKTWVTEGMGTPGSFMETVGVEQIPYKGDFLSRFSAEGVLEWSTYFTGSMGSHGWESTLSYSDSYVLMTGSVVSQDLPIIGNALQPVMDEESNQPNIGMDGFMAKFTTDGTPVWSTYFGTNLREEMYASGILTDGKFYVAGTTMGAGLPTTSGSYQPEISGYGKDLFLFVFQDNLLLKTDNWAGETGLMYPNPASNYVHIDYGAVQQGSVEVEIYDLGGRKVFASPLASERIDLDLPAGMYIVHIMAGGVSVHSGKLVVD